MPRLPDKQKQVNWVRAKVRTPDSGYPLDAWVLRIGERRLLTAISDAGIIEAVSDDDRKLIGQALADAIAPNAPGERPAREKEKA